MDCFERAVNDYAATHNLIRKGDRIAVGLSGGADSVALLAVLTALGHECLAVHCNYHLRGSESDRDEQLARDTAATLGCTVIVGHFTPAGAGIEAKCRDMRYGLFERVARERQCGLIAVGHHLEDNVETFIYNAMRGGASVRGLKAMKPRRNNVIRPLLGVTRSDIESYLDRRGLQWINDSTNASNDYARNRIRNIIMPAMRATCADADRRIADTIARIADNHLLLSDYTSMMRRMYTLSDGSIDIRRIINEHPHPRQALYELLNHRDTDAAPVMSAQQIADITDSAVRTDEPRRFICSDGSVMVLEHGTLHRLADEAQTINFNLADGLEGVISASIITPETFAPVRDPYTIYLDVDLLDLSADATLRPARRGDRLHPYGMRGSRLISDIYHEAGLSTNDRRQALILEHGGRILWVVGIRASSHCPVTPETRRILRLTAPTMQTKQP